MMKEGWLYTFAIVSMRSNSIVILFQGCSYCFACVISRKIPKEFLLGFWDKNRSKTSFIFGLNLFFVFPIYISLLFSLVD